jgi:hypothetical protein
MKVSLRSRTNEGCCGKRSFTDVQDDELCGAAFTFSGAPTLSVILSEVEGPLAHRQPSFVLERSETFRQSGP